MFDTSVERHEGVKKFCKKRSRNKYCELYEIVYF